MERVLEEFGKWFLNLALALAIGLIIQPLAKGEISLSTTVWVIVLIIFLLAVGNAMLYLSTKVGGNEK